MRTLQTTISLFIALALSLACGGGKSKDNNDNNNHFSGGSGVYVAGYVNGNAALWKDGKLQRLTNHPPNYNSATANSVFVSGTDVYVAGTDFTDIKNGDTAGATLWKNGVTQRLGSNGSRANSVFVSGGDVYVAGEQGMRPMLWKNGVRQKPSEAAQLIYSVFVSDNDVYVAGREFVSGVGGRQVVWKNGIVQTIIPSGLDISPLTLFVSDSDVYVAGYHDGIAHLWKNGVAQTLDVGSNKDNYEYGFAYSVFVSDNDVYVAGEEVYKNPKTYEQRQAKLWKNGVAQTLDAVEGDGDTRAHSVFVVK